MSRGEFVPNRQTAGTVVGIAVPIILLFIVAYIAWQGFYTVKPHEQAVVLRFGKYSSTKGPGLHFKIPLVDQAVKVYTAEDEMRLPYAVRESPTAGFEVDRSGQDEQLILTGDLYAAVVEWNINYRVIEPKDYLFSINADDIKDVITGVARASMHRIVGDYSADEILTEKREEIGLAALEEMRSTLDRYECGIEIVDLQMQRVVPPARVRPAFDEVNSSIQQRDQLVNEAKREENRLIPQAEAARDKLIREAEGYAARRRAEAQGEISALMAKYKEYREAPEVTRERLYLEAMEKVMAGSGDKIVLDGDLEGLLPLLNLQTSGNQQ